MLSAGYARVLPDGSGVSPDGHLVLGGVDTVSLAQQFGTPLYVYDAGTLLRRARDYRDGLAGSYPGATTVCYASKAYCAPWLLRLLSEEGLSFDVVSGGEIGVALRAGIAAEKLYFHGNNKSEDELAFAVGSGIGRVVVDSLDEIPRVARLATDRGVRQTVLLRVTPGVEAHTHEYIKTGVLDTKFGLSLQTGAAEQGIRAICAEPSLDLVGLHAHIGSQIFDAEPYRETIARVLGFARHMSERHGLALRELSPGGGFGVAYTEEDEPPPPRQIAQVLGAALTQLLPEAGFHKWPRISIEPGRSIVGPAGVALYRVGSIKEIPGVRTYVAVDGGMGDNMRPSTYGAVYTALLANRASEPPSTHVAVAGRYCESGDVLVRDAALPAVRLGDLVALPVSGAYNLAMASSYNLVPRPAVVVVQNGQARLVRRRETLDDLLAPEIF